MVPHLFSIHLLTNFTSIKIYLTELVTISHQRRRIEFSKHGRQDYLKAQGRHHRLHFGGGGRNHDPQKALRKKPFNVENLKFDQKRDFFRLYDVTNIFKMLSFDLDSVKVIEIDTFGLLLIKERKYVKL